MLRGQPGQPLQLGRVPHFVGYENVPDAGAHHRLGLDTFWQQMPRKLPRAPSAAA